MKYNTNTVNHYLLRKNKSNETQNHNPNIQNYVTCTINKQDPHTNSNKKVKTMEMRPSGSEYYFCQFLSILL
jgi:hypothetical protein